ncbi:MAG: metallophosphoesterase [Chloroflexota bacterium]
MRIALVSDCEGNARALEAALVAMRSTSPDLIVHAGDILRCPFSPEPPGETIALLRAEGIVAVLGNHDRYLADWGTARWPSTQWMRFRRSDPVGSWFTRIPDGQALLAPADLRWLRDQPEELVLGDGVYVCHGSPGNPWNSIWPRHPTYDGNVSDMDRDASLAMLAERDVELALCGHVPEPWEYRDRLPNGRELRVVRAGARSEGRVGYAIITGRRGAWQVDWGDASY